MNFFGKDLQDLSARIAALIVTDNRVRVSTEPPLVISELLARVVENEIRLFIAQGAGGVPLLMPEMPSSRLKIGLPWYTVVIGEPGHEKVVRNSSGGIYQGPSKRFLEIILEDFPEGSRVIQVDVI